MRNSMAKFLQDHIGAEKNILVLVLGAVVSSVVTLAVPFVLLVVCNVIDYATGLAAAPNRGQERNSDKGFRGILKKVLMWLLVALGLVFDVLLYFAGLILGWTLPFNFLVATLVCVWLLSNEAISIIENVSDAGVDVPPFLLPVVNWVKSRAEKNAEEVGGDGEKPSGGE